MVILRSQNKITDFFMILSWDCPFNIIRVSVTIVQTLVQLVQNNAAITFQMVLFYLGIKGCIWHFTGTVMCLYPRGVGERRRGWKLLITTKWYIAVKPAKIPLSPVSCEDTSGLIPSAIPETRSMQSPYTARAERQ